MEKGEQLTSILKLLKQQKYSSLTLGFQTDYSETHPIYEELTASVMPESDYLVVNVHPYKNYELGAHLLAAWNVFSEFNYIAYGLKRDLEHAPIYEWDSDVDGYTLYFPISKSN